MYSETTFVLLLLGLFLCVAAASGSASQVLNVTFQTANELKLEGTLRLPSEELWPVPGVVLIHGSGPHNRDYTLQMGQITIPAYAQIGDALQTSGIAVLTYDKRTCGTFNSCSNNSYSYPANDTIVADFVEDALAAVAFLMTRPQVRPDSVVAIGHSQSGQFIPIMLQANPKLKSGVIMSGAFNKVNEILSYQLNFTLDLYQQLGINETAALETPEVALVAELAQGANAIYDGTSNASVGGVSADFWRNWFDIADQALDAAATISQPMLFLHGELDWTVPPTEAQLWHEYLTEVGASHTLTILPCVSHPLNCLSESNPAKLTPDQIGTEVAPEVIDALTQFVLSSTEDISGGSRLGGTYFQAAHVMFVFLAGLYFFVLVR